ncbi:hypothetical protein E2C01_102500 [Portunus trituberculatus]|uniref:Uncharacterized protein n=1 Tax=Portunus trituberculatus TaxID=210409 RepID=A0A5B7KIL4_PORTR|nr:hypothetical protein [Portunus trituberculatus]
MCVAGAGLRRLYLSRERSVKQCGSSNSTQPRHHKQTHFTQPPPQHLIQCWPARAHHSNTNQVNIARYPPQLQKLPTQVYANCYGLYKNLVRLRATK